MLFSSLVFIFAFLPLALVATYATGRWKPAAKIVLTLFSFAFYAWWRPVHLPLLLFSILFNCGVGWRIQTAYAAGRVRAVRVWLIFGLAVDLALLGWFKYANFVADTLNATFDAGVTLPKIALPLAISFFTFQKIAFLVDSARGQAKRMNLLDFSLFAAFFPQLIAGPIVHYKDVAPQIQSRLFAHYIPRNLMIGLVIFAIGLVKKTVIADTLALQVNPLYAAAGGQDLGLAAGWLAAVAFTLQIYFDFSGYSDMAIGAARMFGIKLPLNFHSPLRAASILDYWRRWHMTLQRFIRSYVFEPLALPLTRFAMGRSMSAWPTFAIGVATPAFLTFIVVGIWHGAGWTFVAYGLMNAVFVCINEFWRARRNLKRRAWRKLEKALPDPAGLELAFYHGMTLVAVLFSNVVFRATTVEDALSIWRGMIGLHGVFSPSDPAWAGAGAILTILISALIVFLAPNTQQIMGRFNPALNWNEWKAVAPALIRWRWKPSWAGILFAGAALFFGVMFIQRGQAVFLYFNF